MSYILLNNQLILLKFRLMFSPMLLKMMLLNPMMEKLALKYWKTNKIFRKEKKKINKRFKMLKILSNFIFRACKVSNW